MIDQTKSEFIDFLKATCSQVQAPAESTTSEGKLALSRRQRLTNEPDSSESSQLNHVDSLCSVPR